MPTAGGGTIVGIELTIPVVLGIAGAALVLLGYRSKKKEDKTLLYALGVIALAGFAISGGYISLATSTTGAGGNTVQTPVGTWKITVAACDDGAGVSSISVKADGSQCQLDINSTAYAATQLNVTVNIFNQNPTQTTQPYAAQMTYGAISSVPAPASGASYPLVGFLSDGVTYNINWTAVGSAPTASSLGLGVYTATFTSLDNGQEKATINFNTAAFAQMVVGNDYTINLVVAGVTLPVVIHASS